MTDLAGRTAASVEPPRDRWNRPKIRQADGSEVAYTRCTTFIDCLDDKHNVHQWRQRMLAGGLAVRDDLRIRAASTAAVLAGTHARLPRPPGAEEAPKLCQCGAELNRRGNCPEESKAKKTMDQVCSSAIEAFSASAKANIGSAFHDYADLINRGQPLPHVPVELVPAVEAYIQTLQQLQATVAASELFVVNDELQVGGTLDLLMQLPDLGLVVGDVKTGQSTVEYGMTKVAMQIAMYARSYRYDPRTGERTPLGVNTEAGVMLAVSVPQGTCEPYWIDLAAGWELCLLAGEIRRARKVVEPYKPWAQRPGVQAGHAVTQLAQGPGPDPARLTMTEQVVIEALAVADLTEMDLLWQTGVTHGTWTDRMTEAARARAAELTQQGGQ